MARCRKSGRVEFDPFMSPVADDDDDPSAAMHGRRIGEAKPDYESAGRTA